MHSNSADVVCSTRHKSKKYSKRKTHSQEIDIFIKKSQADDLCRVLKQLASSLELQRFRQQGWGLLNEFLKVRCGTMFIQCSLICVSEKKVVNNGSMVNIDTLQKEGTEGRSWT